MYSPGGNVPKKSGGRGCLIAIAVSLLIVIGVGVWIALSIKGWAAWGMKTAAVSMVNESQLPAEQKAAITTRVEQVTADWKAGKITNDQLGHIMEEITEGPILPLGLVGLADQMYVEPSALTPEEKAAGRRSLQRFARGVIEETIKKDAVQELLDIVSFKNPGGGTQMKQTLTPAELQSLLTAAKTHADKANVPDEPYTINYAGELDRAVQRAMEKAK